MWTRLLQLLLTNNPLNTHLTKIPNRFDSTCTTKPIFSSLMSSTTTTQSPKMGHLEEVRVDMAEMKIERRPVSLVTNVGSCVAICIHDPINKCGGMAHIMLPSSSICRKDVLHSKYADTAVPALTKALKQSGKCSFALSAKIAGGANMFPNLNSNTMNIGTKNVEAVKQALTEHGIKLLAEDVTGIVGRKVTFNVVTGEVYVRNGNGDATKI
ncbi:MAG: chemotaxis protein CheD [Candidatus Bathyarchaeota archaeon]|nr:chemotaxis protein CheD [Candidatus Bathyarchaeum tardum]